MTHAIFDRYPSSVTNTASLPATAHEPEADPAPQHIDGERGIVLAHPDSLDADSMERVRQSRLRRWQALPRVR